MKKISVFLLWIFLGVALSGCARHEFTVTGVIAGAEGQVMYLENVGLASISLIDSFKLPAAGRFTFTRESTRYPEFYRLRLNNQWINFAVDSTETITITADAGTFATSYNIDGSSDAKAIKAITLAQLDASQAIGRLRKEREGNLIPDTTYQSQVAAVSEGYKEFAKQYIYTAPMSTAAYFALFQQIDGLLFFDLYNKDDSKAYAAVATSFDHYYPNSNRAKHLHNLALQSIKIIRRQRALDQEVVNIRQVSYLDIALPSLRSGRISLSDVAKGKNVLVNFTAYQTEWSPELNMALGDIYAEYGGADFEIYQVSLDSDTHYWKNIASRLPWVCVHDPESGYSQVAALYNVKQLPALFLIDKKGDLIRRVDNLSDLGPAIRSLTR
ncbi:MAG: AhpC/TSA family protein [Tannerellaceae bacterium]|jgi:hypothetical protein|nr:AhpC/TSA family protein [Tannerellaceae bacterium]